MSNMHQNPYVEEERAIWVMLRNKHIAMGDNPLHPAFRYGSWEDFVAAGKPWHNHGESRFHNMTWGEKSLRWEARRLEPKYDPIKEIRRLQELGLFPIEPRKPRVEPMQPPGSSSNPIPAAVRLQMLADANGGLGPTGLTPSSPESAIRSYLESVDRNGFKPPGNIRLA